MSDRPEDDPQEPEADAEAGSTNVPADPGEQAEAFADYGGEEEDVAYTLADFHNVVQKQIVNATYETLVETKLDWALVEPFLHAAREICRADFVRTGRVQVHGAVAEADRWAEAEEAYLSLSIADQDDGSEWLSQTWWLSDLVLAGDDPARVREAVGALERSLDKLRAWLADNQAKGPDADG